MINNFKIEGKCITELLWKQAQANPNNIAIIDAYQVLTYDQLLKNTIDLAIYIQSLGVTLDECVGLFFDSSVELIVHVWGILFAGGAYLPLATEYPEERLRYMVEDSCAKIIFTQDHLKKRLSKFMPNNIRIISSHDMKKFKQKYLKTPNKYLRNSLRPSNLAYMIYTSGSTGRPKGVLIEHRSIFNQMKWLEKTFHLDHRSTILQKTSICFDAAQWEILAAAFGGKIVITCGQSQKDPEQLIATIKKYRVTTLQCAPTLLQAFLDSDEFHDCDTLTQIFSGGEALSKSLALKCLNTLPKCSLVNLYGPTECTINTSSFVVDPLKITAAQFPDTVPIGKAIDNTQYHVFVNNKVSTTVGEIGELYISGCGLARGYHRLPELTAEKFIDDKKRLYKTGDLVHWNPDGTMQYVGRIDNQIKLRGFRLELDEIKSRIKAHDWVKHAAVILTNNPYTEYQNLIAFVELDSKEATLMDQGNHDAHHKSKENKAQVVMQLSNIGCIPKAQMQEKPFFALAGKIPSEEQIKKVFARKTYRFFEGGAVKKKDILKLMLPIRSRHHFNKIEHLNYANFGEILRYFGQFITPERLLPKYGYASPGALYATQMYLELSCFDVLPAGYYYYHPVHHELICVKRKTNYLHNTTEIKVHFVGKKSAIEPIYKNNVQEVLEIETGHMIGLFENILPEYGLDIVDCHYTASVKELLGVSKEDFYLGTFQIISGLKEKMDEEIDIYIQAHPNRIKDFPAGTYHYQNGVLKLISDEIILKKHMIAINQAVYDRSSFGVTLLSKTHKSWMAYINLGRKLQSLQMNHLKIGLISSGYSSKTGHDLPSAKKICDTLKKDSGPSYFFMGGCVSDEQINHRGMKEDTVHMKGPAEMLREDLTDFLPDYMLPHKIILLDKMPITLNGKIDVDALKSNVFKSMKQNHVVPRNEIERSMLSIWKSIITKDQISIHDNFFELGGNSLIAIQLTHKINKVFDVSLPLQTLFEYPTIEKIVTQIDDNTKKAMSRLVMLRKSQAEQRNSKSAIYCWPGLGGYCMNLKLLSEKVNTKRSIYGIQTHGINVNETPHATLSKMAEEDIKLIKKIQPTGPYTLWGYSFGAQVAFEAAYQLERSGEKIEHLFLIAPGSPTTAKNQKWDCNALATYDNHQYLIILFSVFMGNINSDEAKECLKIVKDEQSFIEYIISKNKTLDVELVKRIMLVVSKTYGIKYSPQDLEQRLLKTPVVLFRARGDQDSFIENHPKIASKSLIKIFLGFDHYSILKNPGIEALVRMLNKFIMEFSNYNNLPINIGSHRNNENAIYNDTNIAGRA